MTELIKRQTGELSKFDGVSLVQNCIKQSYSLTEVLKSKNLPLGNMENANEFVLLAFTSIMKAANVPALNLDAMEMLVNDIVQEDSQLTIPDVVLMLKNGVKGKYGKFYGRIGLDTILGKDGWIEQYKEARAIELESLIKAKQNAYNGRKYVPNENDISSDKFHKLHPELKHRKRLKKTPKKGFKGYRSIYDYCKDKEIDYKEYMRPLVDAWTIEYKVNQQKIPSDWSLKIFIGMKSQSHLVEIINKENV